MQPKIFPATAFVLATSLLLAMFCGFSAFNSALAQSPPLAPDAPGSISGSVTDSSGAPLSGIDVTLHRRDSDGYYSYWRSTRTDAQGAYRFGVLPAGTYALSFRDQSSVYAQTFYSNALTLQSATPIAVAGANVTDLNVAMPKAGAIQGLITATVRGFDPSGRIDLYARMEDEWQSVVSAWVGTRDVYTLSGLHPGVYVVCAQGIYYENLTPGPVSSYPRLCYPDIYSSVNYAQPVTVTEGSITMDIDLIFGVEGDGASIGGVVRSPNGAPLEGIHVYLSRRNFWGFPDDPEYPFYDGASAVTDATGRYEFRWLRPGDYSLYFEDGQGPYISEFYRSASSYADATLIPVERYEKRLDIDTELKLGGVIRGRLTIFGEEKPDQAQVILQNGPGPFRWFSRYNNLTGHYEIAGIPPGVYYVMATGMLNQMNFQGYYGDGSEHHGRNEATPIAIIPGTVLENIDIELGEVSLFDGALEGQVRAGGRPLPSARVMLYSSGNTSTPIVESFTDAEGRYLFGGLTEGQYRIAVSDPSEMYATTFYSDHISLMDASHIQLTSGEQRTNVDVELAPGGWITGQVVADNNRPAARFNVYAWYVLQNPGAEYAYGTLFPLIQRATTDQNGHYRLGGLRAGSYRLCTGPGGRFPGGLLACFGLPPGLIDPYQAANVEVRAGQTTGGVDMFVGERLPSNSYLPLLMR